ncbi:hypothetical protein MSAN_00261700 [Mycena sanguinolenta]|uniref:Uncharacterized protein n=1 Tax=Mycena sanguinolenta TaxID=230812 RepID=A0A8H7DP74_9AGAR|nr:hypothetical protein MSAN_00261700 [Mycena sanguinolenta]
MPETKKSCTCSKVCGLAGDWIPKSTYHKHNASAKRSAGCNQRRSDSDAEMNDLEMDVDPPDAFHDSSAPNQDPTSSTSDLFTGATESAPLNQDRFDPPQSSNFDPAPNTPEQMDQDRETPRPPSPSDNPWAEPHLITNEFIRALRNASLDSNKEKLDPDTLHRLRNPLQEPPTLNADERLSINIFLAVSNASEQTYNSVRDALLRRYPENPILSHHSVKKLVSDLTHVVYVTHDMCVNSCMAFTGPFAHLDHCRYEDCGEPRYDPKRPAAQVPRQQFNTILLGRHVQALRRSIEGTTELRYREQVTKAILEDLDENEGTKMLPYTDFFDGTNYIDTVHTEKIERGDNILMLSVDGAQLYRNKTSDCWTAAWMLMDRPLNIRFKKRAILPDVIIPGRKNPNTAIASSIPDSITSPLCKTRA